MPMIEAAWEKKVIEALTDVGWKYVPAEQLMQ